MLRGALRTPFGATRAAALVVAMTSIAWLLRAAFEPLRLNWGDPWSDANVLTTLEYSARYGLWKTSFTDVLDIGPLTAESYRYTHYPPLAEITYGVVRKVVGKADIGVYRLFAIAFSAAGLYAVHAYVSRVFGKLAGACAVILFATNALFLQYADSIHQAPVLGCMSFAALAFVARYVDEQRRRDLLLTAVFTFLSFLTAYDFYFFLPLAAVGTAWLCGKRLFERVTLHLVTAIVVGATLAIVVKSLFIIGALGWHEFKEDLIFQFFERATTKYSVDYRLGLAKIIAARVFLYMTPLFFVMLVGHAALARHTWRSHDRRSSVAAPFVLMVAGVPFLVVFSQLTATQVLPMQCIVPYYAIGLGVLAARLLESAGRARQITALAMMSSLVLWQVVHVARFEKAFLHDDDQKRVAAYLNEQDKNDWVFTNLLSDGPIQYYFQRHLQPMSPVWSAPSYRSLLRHVGPGQLHIVFFDDPKTRFVDKSLFPLLAGEVRVPREPEWTTIGAPPFAKAAAMDAIVVFDQSLRATFAAISTRRLQAGAITVYSVGMEELRGLMRRSTSLAGPTKSIAFGEEWADELKLYGMRPREPGKAHSWTIPRPRDRTVLTKTGVVWRDGGVALLEAGILLNLPLGSDFKVTVRVFSHLPQQTLAAMVGERVLLPAEPLGTPWEARDLSFVVPQDARGADPVVTIRFPFAVAGKAPGVLAWDGHDDVGVAFESLLVERLEPTE